MIKYKYIYGPVNSWRLGLSLGIDLLSQKKKVCTFDCVYCQVGRVKPCSGTRKIYIPTKAILDEIRSLPDIKIDYITFSGSGEPTLAKNLGTLIRSIRRIRKEKIAVLTNATLLNRKDVQNELKEADLVEAKLDASSDDTLSIINNPTKNLDIKKIVLAIKSFKRIYKGKLILQIMLTKANIGYVKGIAELAKSIKPYAADLNTPLRPSSIKPITKLQMKQAAACFQGLRVRTVFDTKPYNNKAKPIDKRAVAKRRGVPNL